MMTENPKVLKIVCSRCNETVTAIYQYVGAPTNDDIELLAEMKKVPCSKCVPLPNFIAEYAEGG